jgi:hypothetical protein
MCAARSVDAEVPPASRPAPAGAVRWLIVDGVPDAGG